MKSLLSALIILPVLLFVAPTCAEVIENSVHLPISMTVLPCSGETIELTGSLHIVNSITENDNSYHVLSLSQLQGMSGEGATTGKYRASGVTKDETNINGVFPMNYSLVNDFRLVGQGPENNFGVHIVTHVTINAAGDVTADVSNVQVECR